MIVVRSASNFSLLSEKLCCWCQFEVTILSCTLQFFTAHVWLALLIAQGGQVSQFRQQGGVIHLGQVGKWVRRV
jgi:hypothetical protein